MSVVYRSFFVPSTAAADAAAVCNDIGGELAGMFTATFPSSSNGRVSSGAVSSDNVLLSGSRASVIAATSSVTEDEVDRFLNNLVITDLLAVNPLQQISDLEDEMDMLFGSDLPEWSQPGPEDDGYANGVYVKVTGVEDTAVVQSMKNNNKSALGWPDWRLAWSREEGYVL